MAWTETTGSVARVVAAGPPEPGPTADELRRVMSDGAYDYSPGIVERITTWIGEQLDRFFGGTTAGASGGTFGGGIGPVLAWVLVIAAVAAVVAVLVVAWRRRLPRDRDEEPVGEVELDHRRPAGDWAAEAEALEAAGDWKGALRARYRQLVRTLIDRDRLPDVPGRTTGELRLDLDRTSPAATDDFDTCCLLFELAWYAELPTGPEESARFRSSADRVLAAPAEATARPDPLVPVAPA